MSLFQHTAAVNYFCLFIDAVPEVNIPLMMRNISVPEPMDEVPICIELSTGITEQVVVTAVTGPKSGAANQATGRLSRKIKS